MALVENYIPQAMICVKFGDKLPQNNAVYSSDEPNMSKDAFHRYAIFYSIFSLQHATLKGARAIAIKKPKEYYKEKCIKRFYTLSPIPQL